MIYESEKEREKRESRKWEKIGRDMAKRIIKDARKACEL